MIKWHLDIRFCFDGWVGTASPVLQCATDFGESCNSYLINITDNVKSNLNYYGTKLSCQLFRPPQRTFKLGRTNDRLAHSGSFLKFYYFYLIHDIIYSKLVYLPINKKYNM